MFSNRQFIMSLVNSGDYEIDWANPITQGLRVFFHDGRNLVNGTLCTPSSAAVGGAWKADAYGKYWAVTGDTEYWEVPMTGMLRNSGANTTDLYIGNDRAKFTVLAFAQTSSGGAGYNTVVSHTEAGVAGGWYLSSRVYASGGLLGCTQGGAGYVTSNITPSTSKPQVFGCAYGASNADFICDGVLNTGVSNIASAYCTPNKIRIGARNNHNGDGEGMTSGDKLYWAMIWSRRLGVGELESINDNPMQIIKPRFGRLMRIPSATGATGTSAITLDDAATAAAATFGSSITATSAITLDDAATAAAATFGSSITATSAITLDDASTAATATFGSNITSTSAITLDDATTAAAATFGSNITATSAITLDDATTAATATIGDVISATAAITLDDATTAAAATVESGITGASAITLDDAATAAAATFGSPIAATSAITLANVQTSIVAFFGQAPLVVPNVSRVYFAKRKSRIIKAGKF